MLFLLGGKHGSLVRTVLGAALLVIGLVFSKGWMIMAIIGAVLLVWGAYGLITEAVARRRAAARSERSS